MRTDKEIDYLEKQIPELAKYSVKKAYIDTLSKGYSVMECINNKIYMVSPDGSKTYVKDAPAPVKVNLKMKI